MQSSASTPDSPPSTRDGSPGSVTLQLKHQYALANQRTPPTPDVRLYHRAVVVAQDTPGVYMTCLLSSPQSCCGCLRLSRFAYDLSVVLLIELLWLLKTLQVRV